MAELSLIRETGNVAGKDKVFPFFTRVAVGLLLLFLLSAERVESDGMEPLGPCLPPGTGDWDVSSPATCQDMAIVMNGNILVTSALELINVTLVFNSISAEGYRLDANSGSILRIFNSSITSSSIDNHFSIFVRDNVNFSMVGSLVVGAGAKDPELFANETPATNSTRYAEYGRFLWGGQGVWELSLWLDDGIQINTTVTEFSNNTFIDFTAIWFFSDNNVIENNSFTGMKHHGLGFMAGSDNNRVIGNYFSHAARMNRQIYGIKFFPGTNNGEIAFNTIEWVPVAMGVTEIPPYSGGSGFWFHHNRVTKVVYAVMMDADNVLFSEENYSEIYAMGISISSYYNITIQNSTFRNLSFQEELNEVIDQDYFNECWTRKAFPHPVYWMFIFYTTKTFLKATSYGNLLVVKDNYFGYGPPYTSAIVFDGAVHNNFRTDNNTFEMIGNYIPQGFTTTRDGVLQVSLAGNYNLPGAAISLEGISKANIEGNVFKNVVHGILTSTPDSLGTYGAYTIKNNVFEGVGNFTWQEHYWLNWWWWDDMLWNHTENGIGIGLGTHGWQTAGGDWGCQDTPIDHWLHLTYISDVNQTIENNTFKNFSYPIVIDYSRVTDCEKKVLGPKHAKIFNNTFFNYTNFTLMNGPPSTIEFDEVDNRQYCDDGTENGYCSITHPFFCQNGSLVKRCSVCWCPAGYKCEPNGTCSPQHCSDGTEYGYCSITQPLYCMNGMLIPDCYGCGCPAGYRCELNETCSTNITIPICGPYDADASGRIEASELIVAIVDWYQGDIFIQDIIRYATDFGNSTCISP